MPALQGNIVEWPCGTPTIGFPKSAGVKPTGYDMERFAARSSPSVMTRERLLRVTLSSRISLKQYQTGAIGDHHKEGPFNRLDCYPHVSEDEPRMPAQRGSLTTTECIP